MLYKSTHMIEIIITSWCFGHYFNSFSFGLGLCFLLSVYTRIHMYKAENKSLEFNSKDIISDNDMRNVISLELTKG